MIHVLAFIQVKPGRRAEFIDLFKTNVPNVLAEDGCIQYVPAVDADTELGLQVKDENVVTVIEKWECLSALEAHLQAPHMSSFREKVADIVEGATVKVLREA